MSVKSFIPAKTAGYQWTCKRIWNNIILLPDQLESDLHRNDRQVWYY